jgi:PII-like signaling protein
LPHDIKHDLMRTLYRMNISYTTLYPGIEGFGKSLKHLYHIDGIMKLENDIKDYLSYKKKFE